MKGPTVSQAYAMIRYLKKRNEPGDATKITELKNFIEEEKLKIAAQDVERFLTSNAADPRQLEIPSTPRGKR